MMIIIIIMLMMMIIMDEMKEEEEKEGRVCCNKLEFLLLHNKQTNEGFHRLISLSLSLSVLHSLITC
jgi:hypothetical protein